MKRSILALSCLAALGACSKDEPAIISSPPSAGSEMTLNGIADKESGTSAGNSVYVDFSANEQKSVLRSSWDLGFYCGSDFRVIINNTTSAIAHVTTKDDINTVNASDTVGKKFAFNQAQPAATDYALIDDVNGDLSKTVIAAVNATPASNKVYIINRGTGGNIAPRSFVKVKINRNGNNGYTLQYAQLTETTYKTINIDKDSKYNFKYISFDNGAVNVENEKINWDIEWTYALFQTSFGNGLVPYAFSDLVAINDKGGVSAFEKTYANAETATTAYNNFNKDSLAANTFKNDRWLIGSNWRVTSSLSGSSEAVGIRKNRFYVIKDVAGNAYKLKFIAAGLANDGGTRGKPQIKFELIK